MHHVFSLSVSVLSNSSNKFNGIEHHEVKWVIHYIKSRGQHQCDIKCFGEIWITFHFILFIHKLGAKLVALQRRGYRTDKVKVIVYLKSMGKNLKNVSLTFFGMY